jgi:predicted ATPase/signal transduction histidine kinase
MNNILHYQVDQQIYASNYSLIYRGIRLFDQQPVILKLLKGDYPSPTELERYQHEYEITQSLSAVPDVIKVYALEKYHNRLLLILEDFGGDSLKMLSPQHYWDIATFLKLALQITQVLGEIHGARVIHKDLNPSNLIFNPATEQLKLIDFGIATRLPRENLSLKNPHQLEGTLAYLSPEQTGRMNRAVDYRTDFYALGVTFYELLTGRLPFESEDAMELVHCHLAKQPLPPLQINPVIPLPLSNLILKLIAKTAEDRYQSAGGLKHDLEACQRQLAATGQIAAFPLAQQDCSTYLNLPQKRYGREVELQQLLAAFDRVAEGRSELLLVAGYSGIGKSSLVQEIYQPITAKRGHFIAGKFDQFQRNIPYLAITQAFRHFSQQLLTATSEQLAYWQEQLLAAVGVNGQVIIEVIPEVELLLGKQPPVPTLPPTESQNRLYLVLQNFIRAGAQAEHPLVIFLDDLQWVDLASLKLITLMSDIPYLLLIGAYRDNEVDSMHPLMLTLKEMRTAGIAWQILTLTPLTLPQINQFIADMLNQPLAQTLPLAQLLAEKTAGNPFFLGEFVKTLYAENLLQFDWQQQVWQWDIADIKARNMTANVVELLVNKIQQLPLPTQKQLKLAAAIGNQFDLTTLVTVSQSSPDQVKADLWAALVEGLVIVLEEEYQFVHDRVQQAAYLLITAAEKAAIHWQIGTLLLQHISPTAQEERLFILVEQLNKGSELITTRQEKIQLAELNWRAGKKAKLANAHEDALKYFRMGINLLDESVWQDNYELTLELHIETLHAELLILHHEQVEQLATEIRSKAKTLLDKIRVDELEIQFLISQDKQNIAIDQAIAVLRLLKIVLPSDPNQIRSYAATLKQDIAKNAEQVAPLIDLPTMTNPVQLAVMRILMKISGPAYVMRPDLWEVVILIMVQWSIRYGNSPLAAFGYGFYAVLLVGVYQDIKTGYQFGQLSMQVLDKFAARELKAKIINLFDVFVRHWQEPLRNSLVTLPDGIQSGIEVGDFEYGCYNAIQYSKHQICSGLPLLEVLEKQNHYLKLMKQLKMLYHLNFGKIWWQFNLNLLGHSDDPCQLVGEEFNETQIIPLLLAEASNFLVFNIYCCKLILLYLHGKYPEAMAVAQASKQYENYVPGMLETTEHNFFYSLALLANYPQLESEPQQLALQQVVANQQQMSTWSAHAPANFRHKYHLVEAERARILNQPWQAMQFYEQAISGAHTNKYLHEEALAYELAAQFYLTQGLEKIAQVYLQEAYYHYQTWGAQTKLQQLQQIYPQWLVKSLSSPSYSSSNTVNATTEMTTDSIALDLHSIIKASQTLAGEIILNRLLEKMMHLVIENAGANRGVLLLHQSKHWRIQAEIAIDPKMISVLQDLSLETINQTDNLPLIPLAIINYVIRTQDSLLLNDALHQDNFTQDPYVRQRHPRSIFGFPLLHQGKLVGILYLENTLMTGAFTAARLQVLQFLAAPIAISIENALLYQTLENKVQERTQELSQTLEHLKTTQAQLVEAEKMASLGSLVAGVAHEINTPLGVSITAASILENDTTITIQSYENKQLKGSILTNYLDTAKQSSCLILNNLERVKKLIQSFKQVAVDEVTLERRIFRVKQYIHDTLASLAPQLKTTSHQFIVNGDETLELDSYPGALAQIITNLVMNSLQHAYPHHQSGKLYFDVERNSDCAIINYGDDGCGIPHSHLKKVFEPFFTTARAQGGTGLGLHIVYNLVTQKLQGTIRVHSEVGKGTRFMVRLPYLASSYEK